MFSYRLYAQRVFLTDEVDAALRRHCSICASRFPAYDSSLLLKPSNNAAAAYFHNCHILLKSGRLEEARLFAQLTVVAIKDTLHHPLYSNTLFLEAKTAYLENVFPDAIRLYERFLTFKPIDSVLIADAFLSLADIYLKSQDWLKADNYLNTWHRNYIPFTGDGTKRNLYNTIAVIFNVQKISNPHAAVHTITNFFTARKDTGRLMLSYFNIANWYAPQATGKAVTYVQKALTLAVASGNLEQQKNSYLKLSLLEEQQGRFKAALQYRKQYEETVNRIRIITEKKIRQQSHYSYTRSSVGRSKLKEFRILLAVLLPLLLFLALVSIKMVKYSRSARQLHSKVLRLEELNRSKNQLFSVVAHDLRSAVYTLQINIVRIKTLLAQLNINDASEVAEQAERLIGTVQSLLNNLLYWALSQTGQIVYIPEPIALQPLLNGVCYDFSPVAAVKGIVLNCTLTEDFFCTGDVNSVKIIFRNLIDNAIKYTHVNGLVSVSAMQEGDFCSITVQDTGIGMDKAIINALFTSNAERIQEDASGRRSTGIGLWLVKNMTERNGGTLSIVSEAGVGTAVTVTLPIHT